MNKIRKYDGNYNLKYNISTNFIETFNQIEGRSSDLKALLWSLNRYLESKKDDDVKKLVMKTGNLSEEEINQLTKVYIKSMEEIKEMIIYESNNEEKLLQYIGIQNDQLNRYTFLFRFYKNHSELYRNINQLKQYALCIPNRLEIFESYLDIYS